MKKRVYLQGFGVDLLSFSQVLECACDAVNNMDNIQIITINPEMIEAAKKDKDFANVIKHAELIVPDGVGIKIALALKGYKQERIGGCDLSYELVKLCESNGWRLALLGAKEEVMQTLLSKFKNDFPNLNIVYSHNGYFDNENEILNDISKSNPQVLLCALGAPKQEFLIYRLKEMLQGCVMIGVGGSFDVFSGCTKRAPVIWQKLGLEWLYRVIVQPERIKRIFPTLPIFLFESIIDSIKK